MRSLPFLFVCVLISNCTPSVIIRAEQDAIRDTWDASIAAALDSDYTGWTAALSEDVEIVQPSMGLRLLGKSALEPVYRSAFQGAPVYESIETTRFDVQVAPSGEMAWGTAEVDMVVRGEKQTIWFGLVYRKEATGWKMVMGFDAPAN